MSDDTEIEQLKAEALAEFKSLVRILKSESPIQEKRDALTEVYAAEIRCSDCIDRRCAEAFDESPYSARTASMADTALNFLSHLLNFFQIVRTQRTELNFSSSAFNPGPASFSNMQRLVSALHVKRAKRLRKNFTKAELPTIGFDNPFPMPPAPHPSVPRWFSIVGCIFGALTLVFFMALVFAEMFNHPVPPTGRFLVVTVLALGAALSGSFLGGTAVAKGKIPLPIVKDHPIAFTATGGVAILVIVLLIGYYTYIRPGQATTVTRLGSQYLQESASWTYDSVIIPRGTVIQTNGHDLFLHVKDDLVIEGEAVIRAFDYEQIAENPVAPLHAQGGTDGQSYTGSASGTGAQGRDGGNGEAGQPGANGIDGKSAAKIELVVDGKASGTLIVQNRGCDGAPGGDGGPGGKGGNGEGGGPGSGASLAYPGGRHMGSGGKGGNGGPGGDAGHGAEGGSGGNVSIQIGRNGGFILKELEISGGKAGANGKAGPGGLAGQPGGGHGSRGAGRAGKDGHGVSSIPKDGKRGKAELQGVEAPKQ